MTHKNLTYLESHESEKVKLEIFECFNCGFHLGLDTTFLDQIDNILMLCPNCEILLETNYS